MNRDIHFMCEVPVTVNIYRAECSLSDSDSHFFQTLLRAVCLMSVSLTEKKIIISKFRIFNPLNAELNPICNLLALLGAHHFLHVSRIRVKSLTLRLLMSYIYIWSTYS